MNEDNYTILEEGHITVKIKPAKVEDPGMLQTIRQWTKSTEGLTEVQKYITGDTDLKTREEAIRWWLMQLPNWGKVPEGVEITMEEGRLSMHNKEKALYLEMSPKVKGLLRTPCDWLVHCDIGDCNDCPAEKENNKMSYNDGKIWWHRILSAWGCSAGEMNRLVWEMSPIGTSNGKVINEYGVSVEMTLGCARAEDDECCAIECDICPHYSEIKTNKEGEEEMTYDKRIEKNKKKAKAESKCTGTECSCKSSKEETAENDSSSLDRFQIAASIDELIANERVLYTTTRTNIANIVKSLHESMNDHQASIDKLSQLSNSRALLLGKKCIDTDTASYVPDHKIEVALAKFVKNIAPKDNIYHTGIANPLRTLAKETLGLVEPEDKEVASSGLQGLKDKYAKIKQKAVNNYKFTTSGQMSAVASDMLDEIFNAPIKEAIFNKKEDDYDVSDTEQLTDIMEELDHLVRSGFLPSDSKLGKLRGRYYKQKNMLKAMECDKTGSNED